MARGKKSKKPNEPYRFESKARLKESKGGEWKYRYPTQDGKEETDTTAPIWHSMLVSSAFKDLTPRQQMLYVCAKDQFFGARSRPSRDFPEDDRFQGYQGREAFYLNHGLVSKIYGLYPVSNKRDLGKDIKALIEHGFIDLVANGRQTQTRSIYKYSDRWKEWKQNGCDNMSPEDHPN